MNIDGFINLWKKINMKTKLWIDYQSSNIENLKKIYFSWMKIQWRCWDHCLSYLILVAIKHQTNCPVFLSLFYSKLDFHTNRREAGGDPGLVPCCIVMTNKLVMKAKFPSCCQNFTFTRPILTSVYLLIILCNFPA